jgi:cell division protein FtsQ
MQIALRSLSAFWNSPRWVMLLANAMAAFGLLALLTTAAWWLSERPVFRIHEVRVSASAGYELNHVGLGSLQQQLAGYLSSERSASFFQINLDRVRELSESVPWVRHARVRRVWPNQLEISVEEHEALALWDDGRIVNTYGELFTANLAEAEDDGALPEFSGPSGTERQVVSRYAELRRLLLPLDVQPVALTLSSRQAWAAQLSDGTKLMMGREQGIPIEERVRRWVGVYPEAKAKMNGRAELVDLRYPNGFALGEFTNVSESRTNQ